MSTGDYLCGQVKGPVQVGFASSADPVVLLEQSITRVAVTKEEELEKLLSDEKGGKDREMGRKTIVPYGLYRAHVYYSPHYGKVTGVTEEDLGLLWKALVMMWDHDRSAARADMACRGLFVFSHDDPLGNAPAHKLTEMITVTRRGAGEVPSGFADYVIGEPEPGALPPGITYSGNLA
jgi:CRISPR-associated protein Csd2